MLAYLEPWISLFSHMTDSAVFDWRCSMLRSNLTLDAPQIDRAEAQTATHRRMSVREPGRLQKGS